MNHKLTYLSRKIDEGIGNVELAGKLGDRVPEQLEGLEGRRVIIHLRVDPLESRDIEYSRERVNYVGFMRVRKRGEGYTHQGTFRIGRSNWDAIMHSGPGDSVEIEF